MLLRNGVISTRHLRNIGGGKLTKKQKKDLLSAVEKRRKQAFALLDACPLCAKYSRGLGCNDKCPAKAVFLNGHNYCIAFCKARNELWIILNKMVHSLV